MLQVEHYCRMLRVEHSAILLTFIKLPVVIMIMIFVLSIFEWPFYCIHLLKSSADTFIISMFTGGKPRNYHEIVLT